jgi:uncharacterized protein (TIGR02001 family)
MRLMWTGVIGAFLLLAHAAQAEVTMTLTGVSDYDFRGISQSEEDPAVQASVDYAGENFYASAWGSSIDFGQDVDADFELDLVAGFAGETEGGWRWDFGATWYLYPSSNEDLGNLSDPDDDILESPDYWEYFIGGGYGPVDIKYWYSPDLYESDETASYIEANASFGMPWDLSLNLHAGYSSGDYFDLLESDAAANDPDYNGDDADYLDYSIGLGRTFGHFDFELKYVATDTDDYFEVDSGALTNDNRMVLSVSTTIPWSDEASE